MQLRRHTSSGRYIAEIDGLRFLCIVPVVVWHLVAAIAEPAWRSTRDFRLLQVGSSGVELFFIISGFILVLPFAMAQRDGRPGPSLRGYFLRRLTRLEPPYLIALLVVGVPALVGSVYGVGHLLAGLTYSHGLVYGTKNPLDTVTWSLEVEIQFYVLLPLLARVFAVRRPLLRRALVLGTTLAVMMLVVQVHDTRTELTVFGYVGWFAAGFLLADLYVNRWRDRPVWSARWAPVPFVAVGAFIWLVYNGVPGLKHAGPWLSGPVAWSAPIVPAAILMASGFRCGWFRRILRLAPVAVIGGMCYSIYLLHQRVIEVVWRAARPQVTGYTTSTRILVLVVPTLLAVVAVSGVYYVLIERPCMDPRWPQRLRARVASLVGGAPAEPDPPVALAKDA